MLKKISVEHLRLGMFLHEVCGSWLDNPFWRQKFLLDDPKDLQLIKTSSIKDVWIHIGKGADVLPGEESEATEEAVHRAETIAAYRQRPRPPRLAFDEEATRAARICAKAKQAVMRMFQEARMGKAIEVEQVSELVEEISDSVLRNPGALISLARLKTADDYTYMHSVAVCALMIALARQLKLDDQQTYEAGMAGLLHDIGKMATPLDILNKPGRLTEAEFAIVKEHPVQGYEALKDSQGISDIVRDVCLHHHERMDGSGYPDGLVGDQISLFARMGAVCDVYDAITSNRPYKKGWDPAKSLKHMASWGNQYFDPTIFNAFVKSVGIYPIGSFVKLDSGRLGVVVEPGEKSLLKPKVKVFFSAKSKTYITAELLDLASPACNDRIASREEPEKWGIRDVERFWTNQV